VHTVEEKVDRLEKVLEGFIISVRDAQVRTETELRDFKDEMRKDRREMNIKWGEMAKKMGTMVEDLAAPSIPRIVKEKFGLEPRFFGIRVKKWLNGKVKEYDVIEVAGDYVFLNSTKSTLESSDIRDFIKDISVFREFFPEYEDKKIIGMVASLYVDDSVLKYAEKNGLIVLAVGDQIMEIKNTKGFKPKEW